MKLFGIDEGFSISQNTALLLLAAKEMAEINVEETACELLNHVVATVSISDS